MSQEHLSGLALISINQEVSRQVSYDDTIDAFAAKKKCSVLAETRRLSQLLERLLKHFLQKGFKWLVFFLTSKILLVTLV